MLQRPALAKIGFELCINRLNCDEMIFRTATGIGPHFLEFNPLCLLDRFLLEKRLLFRGAFATM